MVSTRLREVVNYTDWRPDEVHLRPRLPQRQAGLVEANGRILDTFEMSQEQQNLLELLSVSFPLVKLIKPHWNDTNPEPEDPDTSAHEAEQAWLDAHGGLEREIQDMWSANIKWDPYVLTR